MFIFNKMNCKVDNRAGAMLRQLEFEKVWRMDAARNMEYQAEGIDWSENPNTKRALLDAACEHRREAIEINEQYRKLKEVLNGLH